MAKLSGRKFSYLVIHFDLRLGSYAKEAFKKLFINILQIMLKFLQSKWLTLSWFVIMCILFFLPGSMLPKETGFFALANLDKIVHIGLFAVFVFLIKCSFTTTPLKYNVPLIVATGLYGYAVEWIQKTCIPGRSFDLFDLLADLVGSITGLLIWLWLIKNKPL
ncbi:MAG: hypothetical protein NVS1B13_02740 [Flavisolibacter sp.]